MRSSIVALAVLASVIPISGTHALVFGVDHRTIAATAPGSLFSPVGIVYNSVQREYATAFLIDDCHALTVQHVFGEQRSVKGRQVVFAANVSGPPQSWQTTSATVVADGGLEAEKAIGVTGRINDWALLRLKRCLGKTFGHVRLSSTVPAPSEQIAIAGYPADRPLSAGLSVDLRCHIRRVRSLALLHDCAALPGNSGSPLFRVTEEGGHPRLEVFAISEAAHSVTDLGRNVMEPWDNYPDAMWNIATVICANEPLVSTGLRCDPPLAR